MSILHAVRRTSARATILAGTLAMATMSCAAGAPGRPNVILLMTDDQGYGDMACHGNPVIQTPNMDRLHSQSVRFTDFHVAPMCSPTRGQLMTGRDAMKNGATAVCQGRSMIRSDIPTMADFFASSGYATGHFGKWHLGDSFPHRPQDRGFQETLHHRAWGITSLADYWQNSYFDPVLEHNGVDTKFEGYCTDIFFEHAMRWIGRCVQDAKPFFLYLATNTPHVPNLVSENYSRPYRGQHEDKTIPDSFYGMIANIDENLGKLEAFLQENDLRDNTILIYLTDNGTQSRLAQAIHNAGMRDRKTSVMEGGHRVPCFFRWPAAPWKHGRDVDELTQVQDLLPTLIDLCGLKAKRPHFDGVSLAGLLQGAERELPDRKLVVQYGASGTRWDHAVVLWKKWRLVGPDHLYNLVDDPHQDRNVAKQYPDVARAMADYYEAWHSEARALFDEPRWITIGSKAANPMMLYAQDWVGGYCDNGGNLLQATATGHWPVDVERAGVYELELRRWPVEADLPLSSGIGPDGKNGARPIASANVQIGSANYTVDSAPEDTHVTFRIRIEGGRTRLATSFLDAQGSTLCSAIYVKLTRLSDTTEIDLTPTSSRKPDSTEAVELSDDDILIADFEGDTYGDWKTTGTAFGKGPTITKGRVFGHQGSRLVDTYLVNESDVPTGTLTSPSFRIERKYINLLIGGGTTPGKTCIRLVLDGKPVCTAVGNATKNARSRKIMRWVAWDVSEFMGQKARLEVVDKASGGWGHIMIDHVFQSRTAMD